MQVAETEHLCYVNSENYFSIKRLVFLTPFSSYKLKVASRCDCVHYVGLVSRIARKRRLLRR